MEGFGTFGQGVTSSCFHRVGYICEDRDVFMISFSGEMRNRVNYFLNLFGRSSGKVERVFLSLFSFVWIDASVTCGGGREGR